MNEKLVSVLMEHMYNKSITLQSATISIQDLLVVKYIDEGGNQFRREFYLNTEDTVVFRELPV